MPKKRAVSDLPLLATRRLNRALLERQLLLERFDGTLEAAVERVGGLQTQYAPSAYIALWSRLGGFRRADLTAALERRQVVQATLMRSTIHIVSRADYPLLAAGIRRGRRDWLMRVLESQLAGIDMERVAARLRFHLRDGPRRAPELQNLLEQDGFPKVAAKNAGAWVDLVRVPPSGTWEQRRADLYGLAEDWVGPVEATEEDGLELLARRYFQGFGPASLADFSSWAGLPQPMLRPLVERLGLVRYRDERGKDLLDWPHAPLPPEDVPAPVKFLPTWDATLLVHARRTQILPEQHRPRIFNTKMPFSAMTFLVDGAVAGTWRYQEGRVRLEAFQPIDAEAERELAAEGERLAQFHGDAEP